MSPITTDVNELAAVPAHYQHAPKVIIPGDDLVLPTARLKWYDIHLPDRPTPSTIRDQARGFLASEVDAGRLKFQQELGYAMLHLDGEGYFLLVCAWRDINELWQAIYGRDDNGFHPYPLKEGPLRPTQNIYELDTTAHERRAWSRYLSSARDEAAKLAYLEDRCTGQLV